MSKGNQKSYSGGISPKTQRLNLSKQEYDNIGLNPVNRVGIPINKHQSRQAYDKEQRELN